MTLTELSYYSRKLMPLGILSLLVLLILFYAIKIILLTGDTEVVIAPQYDKVFGELKPIAIKDASKSAGYNFTLDIIEAEPPNATSSAQIFLLPKSSTKIGFREKIYLMAKTLGFDTDTIHHTLLGTDAIFEDDRQKLSIDISTFNFSYQYNIQQDPALFTNPQLPSEEEIKDKAITFLGQVDRYPQELAQSKPKVTYFVYDPTTGQLGASDTAGPDTNMVEVDFYRADIQSNPAPISVVTSKFYSSQNYVVMVFNDQETKVVKAQVQYFEKSDNQIGIYPIKTGAMAYKDLQQGKGWVVSNPTGERSVTIKKIFFAYYDPDEYQEYLQPVYVYVGDNNFVAYVPAVDNGVSAQQATQQP